jgi:hypothetical protein
MIILFVSFSSHTKAIDTAPVCVSLNRNKNVGCDAAIIFCDASVLPINPINQPINKFEYNHINLPSSQNLSNFCLIS